MLMQCHVDAYLSPVTSSIDSISAQPPKVAPATFKQALFVAVTAGLGYGFDSYAVNIYGLVLPDIKTALHITEAQAGYIGSIFLLGYTIGTIGFGLAADRWGRKTTLGASILLYGVTTSLAGLTTNIAAFTGLRFLTGVGGAGELAVGAPYAAEVWPAKTRAIGVGGVIFSLFSLGYVLAAAVALALGAALRLAIGVRRRDRPRRPAVSGPTGYHRIASVHRRADRSGERARQAPTLAIARGATTPGRGLADLHGQRSRLLGYDAVSDHLHREEVPRLPHRGDPLRAGVLPATGRLCVPGDCARRLGRPTTIGDRSLR